MRKKFTFFFIFLILILLIVGLWYYQKNVYSKEVLKLEILGQTEVELAQEVEYIVKYKNNGNVLLEEPKLIFEYPKNSLITEAGQSSSLRQERELSDIYPGEEKTFRFKARLLGKENEAKIAKAWLSYHPKNLKAGYESFTTFTSLIKSIPITFEFDIPSKLDSGKENLFRLNYFSNLNYPLSNLRIGVEYPTGFEFHESQPKALGNNEWEIPLLNRTEGGRVVITGILSGEVGETKIFRANLGIWQEEEFILLKEITRGVEIAQPSIFISQIINGSPQYTANPGDYLHYEIYFKNTGEKILENLFLIVQLEKDIFDFNTVQVGPGQIRSEAGLIIWDQTVLPQLKFLPSMDEGKVEFWIKLKEDLPQNPVIRTKISVGQAKEEFVNKISSKLEIVQKGYFDDEVFGNSGPIPPRVGERTTYTIMWQIKNYYSDVKNAKVKAILPQGVSLTGKIFPEGESPKFTFDSQSREIVWLVGDLEKGKGVSNTTPSIFFQIALVPQGFQKGLTPEIIGKAQITGEDSWTERTVEFTAEAVNTTLPDDPTIGEGQGIVQ